MHFNQNNFVNNDPQFENFFEHQQSKEYYLVEPALLVLSFSSQDEVHIPGSRQG
jgi:hypothetical protein